MQFPRIWLTALSLAALAWSTQSAVAQDVLPPSRGGFTVSMGVPPTWTWAGGFSAGVHGEDGSKVTAYANLGVYRNLLSPMTGAARSKSWRVMLFVFPALATLIIPMQ